MIREEEERGMKREGCSMYTGIQWKLEAHGTFRMLLKYISLRPICLLSKYKKHKNTLKKMYHPTVLIPPQQSAWIQRDVPVEDNKPMVPAYLISLGSSRFSMHTSLLTL